MTIVSSKMPTDELIAFLREADDMGQLTDVQCDAVRWAIRYAIDRLEQTILGQNTYRGPQS